MAIKAFLFQRAYWEWFRKKSIFQCRHCQRIGHSASNCHLTPRCGKCAGNQLAKECKYTVNTNPGLLKCANCAMEGHPASYQGCLYLKTAKTLRKTKQQSQNNAKHRQLDHISSKINPKVSYAQASRPQLLQHQNT